MAKYSDPTIKRLFGLSGNRCAFPDCRHPLFVGEATLGEMCHIRASAAGGPRYDPSQSKADRNGFENLIVLCPTHHRIVDTDVKTWTVERLLEMKASHEARFQIGDTVGRTDDVSQLIDIIASRLGIKIG